MRSPSAHASTSDGRIGRSRLAHTRCLNVRKPHAWSESVDTVGAGQQHLGVGPATQLLGTDTVLRAALESFESLYRMAFAKITASALEWEWAARSGH